MVFGLIDFWFWKIIGKRAQGISLIGKIVITIAVFAVLLFFLIFFKGKGDTILAGIKNFFKFG
jgi:hypothetical protein